MEQRVCGRGGLGWGSWVGKTQPSSIVTGRFYHTIKTCFNESMNKLYWESGIRCLGLPCGNLNRGESSPRHRRRKIRGLLAREARARGCHYQRAVGYSHWNHYLVTTRVSGSGMRKRWKKSEKKILEVSWEKWYDQEWIKNSVSMWPCGLYTNIPLPAFLWKRGTNLQVSWPRLKVWPLTLEQWKCLWTSEILRILTWLS